MDRNTFRQRRDFLLELGKALHKFGTTASRLENHMLGVCHSLGLDGYFIVSPTMLTMVLWIPGTDKKYNHHIRAKPGELDLGSLAKTNKLVNKVINNELSITEASQNLCGILSAKPPYNRWLTLLAYGLTSMAFASLIGKTWSEVFISFLAGLSVYSTIWFIEAFSSNTDILDPLAALSAALFTGAAQHWFPAINVTQVVLSGIIVLIPGLSITMALKDLAARHLISGTGRLMDSLLCLCKLYFGAALGKAMIAAICPPIAMPEVVANLPSWIPWIAIPCLSLSLVIVFKNPITDLPWSLLCCFIAYFGTVLGADYLGEGLGSFVGALLVGLYSNTWSRAMNTSSLVIMLHGVVLLVPGSKAYIGLNQVVEGVGSDPLLPQQIGVQAFMIFMSILAGLIFANTILPARRQL